VVVVVEDGGTVDAVVVDDGGADVVVEPVGRVVEVVEEVELDDGVGTVSEDVSWRVTGGLPTKLVETSDGRS